MFAQRTNWNLEKNRLTKALDAHRRSGKPLLDLTLSNPTQCGFAYDESAILRALSNPQSLRYEPAPFGVEGARKAVAEYYAARGAEIAWENVVLTTSTSEAYSFLFRALCDPEDEILVPAPSYPLFDFLAEIQDVRVARYPLVYDHGWQMDFAAFEHRLSARTRAAVVVNPNNPTGQFTGRAERGKLHEVCSSRGIAIIADEVFLDFSLRGTATDTFASGGAALTFALSGISKICGLPQMKAAWFVASGPDALRSRALERLEVIADTFLSMNAPVQAALPSFLSLRQGFQAQVMNRVRTNLAELDRQLSAHPSASRLVLEAGWYAVLRVPAVCTDEEWAVDILSKRDVLVHPGHFYDFSSEGYLIVSLIVPEDVFREGIRRVMTMV